MKKLEFVGALLALFSLATSGGAQVAHLPGKTPWTTAKMSPDAMERMMRQILPFSLRVEKVEGTWKLNQNKPEAARLGAAEAVARGTPGSQTADLAALMRAAGVVSPG